MIAARPLLLCDLDGTLVDTLPGLAEAVNAWREERGLTPVSLATVRGWVGGGVRALLSAAGGAAVDDADVAAFLELYARTGLLSGSVPYPGVEAWLRRAVQRCRLAVATNKPAASTDLLLEHLGWRELFVTVVTPERAGTRKPDPAFFTVAVRLAGGPPVAAVVGDSTYDAEGARAAGIPVALVGWGYGPLPERLAPGTRRIERPEELADLCSQEVVG